MRTDMRLPCEFEFGPPFGLSFLAHQAKIGLWRRDDWICDNVPAVPDLAERGRELWCSAQRRRVIFGPYAGRASGGRALHGRRR
mmetsp:Transcript_37815/g.100023  ORF Transcript_37815/g.100023 Transcript_37815/m.100023 type:complete len:84 (-) Transcript_37815:86-337(-)